MADIAEMLSFTVGDTSKLVDGIEMLHTSHGPLTVGLDAQPGQSILIRGGTSSVGMTTAVLARRHGTTVLSTNPQPRPRRRPS